VIDYLKVSKGMKLI